MSDPQLAMMLKEIRQPHHFVAHGHSAQNGLGRNGSRAVGNRAQLVPLAPCAKQQPPPFPTQPIGDTSVPQPLHTRLPVFRRLPADSALFVVMSSLMPPPGIPDH